MKLYFVEDLYDEENWFVFAEDFIKAEEFFIEEEGFDESEQVWGMWVMNCPDHFSIDEPIPCWAQIDHLKALGFEIIRPDTPRIVKIHETYYREGSQQAHIDYLIALLEINSKDN